MRKKLVAGCVVVASAGFGAFAASGLGDQGVSSMNAMSVATHEVRTAPKAVAPAAKASLFRVIYKSTRPTEVPAGYSSVKVRSCPKGAAVLSGWFERTGSDPVGLVDSGGGPQGSRKWRIIVNNTTGESRNAKFGMVCLNG